MPCATRSCPSSRHWQLRWVRWCRARCWSKWCSGGVRGEVVVGLPGIGTLLYKSIPGSDFFVIYGIVFVIIFAIALATLVIDLAYPLLDPRISYRNT